MTETSKFLRRSSEISNFARTRSKFPEGKISFQKVEILAAILNQVDEELETKYFSSGSTVTRDGLRSAHKAICGESFVGELTKKGYLRAILNFFVALSVSYMSKPPPETVVDLVQKIRLPESIENK